MSLHPKIAPDIEQQQLYAAIHHLHPQLEHFICKASTASTNDDALALYQHGYRSALVISQRQTQGRGQHQREWISHAGNIFLSALLKLERPVDGRFALECGLNILHSPSLAQLEHLQLKWANDLYSTKGKWGGILVEPIHSTQIIVGIGINVFPIAQQYTTLNQAVTSLTELGLSHYERSAFLVDIYQAILNAVQWFNHNSQNLAQRYNSVAAFKDQWVILHRQQHADLMGYFRGIQNDGALLIQQASDIHPTVCYDGRLVIPD